MKKQKVTLRTMEAKRRRKIAFMGLLILGVICAFTYATTGTFGHIASAGTMTAVAFAFTLPEGLSETEKASFTAIGGALSKQVQDFLDANKGLSPSDLQTKFEAFSKDLLEKNKPDVTKEMYDSLKSAMEAQGEVLAKLKNDGQSTEKLGLVQVIAKEIEARKNDILNVIQSKSGVVEIDVTKAVGSMTTASGTIPVDAPLITGTQQAPIGNIGLRQIVASQYMTVLATNQAAYPYTETVPKDGDYTFVAEGTVKPQMDFTWSTRWAEPKKIAAWIKVTEESVKDIAGLESVIRDLLSKKHALKKAKALLFATGTGEEPKGATKYGRTFSAGDMALAIAKPNFMDVVNACIVDIATTHN